MLHEITEQLCKLHGNYCTLSLQPIGNYRVTIELASQRSFVGAAVGIGGGLKRAVFCTRAGSE